MQKKHAIAGLTLALIAAMPEMAAAQQRGRGRYAEPAYDEIGPYVGVSAGQLIYKEDYLDTIRPTIAMFRIGQQFSPFLAIEGRIGTGIRGDEAWLYGDRYRVNAELLYAGYVKGILPVSPWFSAYGLAGIGGAQLHRNYPDSHSNDAGLSFGVGAQFALGSGATLNLEWARLTSGTNDQIYDYTADQLTFGVNWRW